MYKAWLLRLHRWTTLLFSLPLAAIILTGLILSFQPMVQNLSIQPGSIDPARIDALIQRHDPDGKARGLFIDPYSRRMTLQGGATVDLTTGAATAPDSSLANLFQWARRTHERLIGLPWLVAASTIAMLALMSLGVLMGLPRNLRNSVSGWHKSAAWFTLPLIVLSPLTGLCLTFGVTFQGAGVAASGKPVPLRAAIQMVAQSHDLAGLMSLGQRGGRQMALIDEGGGSRAFQVTDQGLTELPPNWPRLIHEGNWSDIAGSTINAVISLVFVTLMSTGLFIWAQRKLRRPRRVRAKAEGGVGGAVA